MKKTLFVLLVVLAQGLFAQEAPPAQSRVQEQPPTSQSERRATLAPKLGHPLDPADVAVLSGKANRPAAPNARFEVLPYGYMGYGSYSLYVPQPGQSQFAEVTTATRPPFVPLLFGRIGDRSILLLGNTTTFAPPLFFFTSRNRVRTTLLFAPDRPSLFRRWR